MPAPDRRIDLGSLLKGSIRQTSDRQNFGGARVLIRELPSRDQWDCSCGINHYWFGYRPTRDEPGRTVYTCMDTSGVHVARRDGPFLAAGARFAIDWKSAEGIVANFHFHPAFIEEIASSLRLDPKRLHCNPMRPLTLDDPLESLCRILMHEVEGGASVARAFSKRLAAPWQRQSSSPWSRPSPS